MKLHPAKPNRGIALIMVMMVVIVLITIAGGFAISMKVETTLARNASWDTQLEWMGRSGMEIAKWALAQSRTPEHHLGQAWAGGRFLPEENQGVLDVLKPREWQPFGTGGAELRITIEDLDRKLNLNSPLVYNNRVLLENALSLTGVDASLVPTIASSIKDWIDPDKDPSPNGAEAEFYEQFDPPYHPKNGLLDDVSELLFLKGVRDNPNLYWGADAPATRRLPKSARQSVFEDQQYVTGLRHLFGAWPPAGAQGGLLNRNTASAIALQTIPGIDAGMAEQIIQARQDPGGGDIGPVRGPILGLIGQPPVQGSPAAGTLLKQASDAFEIRVDVKVGKSHKAYVGRLLRRGPQLTLVDFAIEEP